MKKNKHYFLALLFFISLLILFFSVFKDGTRSFFLISDEATLEMRVVNAARSIQYLGPYSRFGWNHPGPIYFYLLLPFYALFSMGTQSLYAGAIFINLVSVFTMLYFIFKSQDKYFSYFTAFFLALYIYYFLGLIVFRSIWNPHVTILPFAALIFICVYLSLGHIKVLPLVVFFSSFLIQTHVAYAPAVMGIVLIALPLYGLEKWRDSKKIRVFFSKEVLIPIGISAGVFLVSWILPIMETLGNPPGNIRKLVYYFASSKTAHSFSEAVCAVSGITNAPLLKLSGKELLLVFFLLQSVLGIAAAIYNSVKKKKYLRNLLVFGLASLIISVISVTKISGEVYIYLIQWMSVIGFINWCAIFYTVFHLAAGLSPFSSDRFARHRIKAGYLIVLILSLVLFILQLKPVQSASQIHRNEAKLKYIGDITHAIKSCVKQNRISSFLMKPHPGIWTIGAGVINELYKSSIPFSLEDNWLFWFGYQFKQTRNEKDIIYFWPEKEPGKSSSDRVLIYHTGECSLYHLKKEL
jgi:hypothetical protein